MSLKGSRRGMRSVARGALRAGAWLGAATLAAGTVQAQQSAGPESDEQDGVARSHRRGGSTARARIGHALHGAAARDSANDHARAARDHGSAKPADDARSPVDVARHHVHGRRGRRRLRRRREPARLHRQQRHLDRRRARQRAVQPHGSVQPRAARARLRREFRLHGRGLGRRLDQSRHEDAARHGGHRSRHRRRQRLVCVA